MEHVFWCIGHELIIKGIVKAQGCYLYDSHDRKYIDFESGVWCTPLGHSHPKINQILKIQIDKISHTGYCYANYNTEEAAIEILETTGIANGKCVFLSSGSEAVEFGVQVLRKISGKPLLLTLFDSFLSSYGSAGKKSEDEWYLLDWSICSLCNHSTECNPRCKIFLDIPFERIGGFVFEPGSSSGLVRFPPKAFIRNLGNYIKQNNGFVQANEITTGIGRTGEWYGYQHYDIQPDVVSMGKGLGNGYPISAIAMSPPVIDRLVELSFRYSQSHQNDPLGCSIAKAVIKVIREENLIERSKRIGLQFIDELNDVCKRCGIVKEVRGRGLMIAIEFFESEKGMPAAFVHRELLQRRFITTCRPGQNVLRIDPPLTVSEEDIQLFLNNLEYVFSTVNFD